MGLFGRKKSKATPADMAFIEEMNSLASDDTDLDGAFTMMEKFQNVDLDKIEEESRIMILKVDFLVFSIKKLVTLLEKGVEGTIESGDVSKEIKEINTEFDEKVKPLYENDD